MTSRNSKGAVRQYSRYQLKLEQFEIIPYLCCQTACWLYCGFINMKEKVAIF